MKKKLEWKKTFLMYKYRLKIIKYYFLRYFNKIPDNHILGSWILVTYPRSFPAKISLFAHFKLRNFNVFSLFVSGFGFVTFQSEDIVDKVCEIHFHEINNKMVSDSSLLFLKLLLGFLIETGKLKNSVWEEIIYLLFWYLLVQKYKLIKKILQALFNLHMYLPEQKSKSE